MSEDDDVLRAITSLMFKRRGRAINDYERVAARERIQRVKPWAKGRIGNVERQICYALPPDGKPMTTSELARFVYEPIVRDKGAPPFKLKSWHRTHIRKAAKTFADCVGRAPTGSGRPLLWRIRYGDLTFHDVRLEKRAKWDKHWRKGLTFRRQKP